MTKTISMLAAAACLFSGAVRAEAPQISAVKVAARDGRTAQVSFDLLWPNAVTRGLHHAALWVFFKTRGERGAEWRPVRLAADQALNPSGFGQGGGTALECVVPDGKDGFTGMFLRRAQDGRGTLVASNVTALLSLDSLKTEHGTPITNLMAFAVEMVYVPEGPFEVGASGQAPRNRLFAYTGREVSRTERSFQTDYSDFADNTPPYRITGPGAIPTGRQPGKLWAQGLAPEDGGEIPASFPNGFAAFYCMPDVLSQGQYTAFLNTLTDAQAKARYHADGHGPEIKRSGTPSNYTYTASAPEEHGVWLSWADGAAYAAWAGLRPMTELEYEKVSRSGSDIRNMNVGNLFERQVSIGSAVGRTFAGSHGDGTPVPPEDWPRDLGGVVFRGDLDGSHSGSLAGRRVPLNVHTDRSIRPTPGWRAVRSAPVGNTAVKAERPPAVIARLAKAVRADGALNEWDKPVAVLKTAADIWPERFRGPPSEQAGEDAAFWQGPDDLSLNIYLGRDGDALCVAVDVTDDKHFNRYASQDIGRGDALQIELTMANAVLWNIGLALTQTGVAFHQWKGANDALAKDGSVAVVRDEAARITRYEMKLPLADLGLEPGNVFSVSAVVFDDDDGFGQCYQIQAVCSRLVVAE